MSTTRKSSSNIAAWCASEPSGRTTTLPPSNTSSSWPPTAFTYTIQEPVSSARSLQISTRSSALPRWNGDPLMLRMTGVSRRAYSSNGGPGIHASSHTDSPSSASPSRIAQAASPGVNVRASSNTP